MSAIILTAGVISLIFGILVLAIPKFLRYAVGIYLIVMGLLQIVGSLW